ncbi:class I SAM-dependent methyltransferase [Stenotrophomonas terrae]|uniref:class I SAM-dependent methyltransferase n=1 Tax=Stenotrophomonas terrae TaxID=405446 RepID=UPI0032082F12
MSREAADQFDQLGALYEDMATWPFRKYIETPSVFAALGPLEGLDVMEYGCGSGYYSRLLKRAGARKVVGYDLAEGMLDYARRCAQRDGLDISFRSTLDESCHAAFDVVLAVYVLPYATTPAELEQMAAEMMAPLRPGGRLVALPIHPRYAPATSYYEGCGFTLTADDSSNPYQEGGRLRLDLRYRQYDASVHAWYWSQQAIEAALHKAGAESIQWSNPTLVAGHDLAGVPPALQAYVDEPHAAIIECRKR